MASRVGEGLGSHQLSQRAAVVSFEHPVKTGTTQDFLCVCGQEPVCESLLAIGVISAIPFLLLWLSSWSAAP